MQYTKLVKAGKVRAKTDRVARGKYDRMEQEDIKIVERVHQLAEAHNCKMSRIALAWQWAKGIRPRRWPRSRTGRPWAGPSRQRSCGRAWR